MEDKEKLTLDRASSLTMISEQLARSPIRWYAREPR